MSRKNNSSESKRGGSNNVNSNSGIAHGQQPRSAAEALMDNNSSKFRQLPCKTFVSVGTCPFGERCVFLHDPRLICNCTHSITRQKNKEDNSTDTFYWPACISDAATKNMEHNYHSYSVPAPKNDQYKLHDQALYSLWMHHVEFSKTNNASASKQQKHQSRHRFSLHEDVSMNPFTQRNRLPVFQLLSSSNGHEILPRQFEVATYDIVASSSLAQSLHDENQQLLHLQSQNELAMQNLRSLHAKQQLLTPKSRSPVFVQSSYRRHASPGSPDNSFSGHTSCASDVSSLSSSSSNSGDEQDDLHDTEECHQEPEVLSDLEIRRRKALSIVSKSEAIQMATKAVFHQRAYYQQAQPVQQQLYQTYY